MKTELLAAYEYPGPFRPMVGNSKYFNGYFHLVVNWYNKETGKYEIRNMVVSKARGLQAIEQEGLGGNYVIEDTAA